ncbi:hypothetical protein ACFPT7_23060 [Acidicapsa dinghuensis]|uniref:Uncharacterized protein n=1 Tax=Acidicapsa dinghuensis TaxID=2218256 RepID=A0ABW1ELS7_9BACT|nr:hypothetical protein [Acidicapsa dinghuensis]
MAAANPIPDVNSASERKTAALLVVAGVMDPEQLEQLAAVVAEGVGEQDVLIAAPDMPPVESIHGIRLVAAAASTPSWILTASDFVNASQLAADHEARGVLLLGQGAWGLRPEVIRAMAEAVLVNQTDLAVPWYDLPPRSGLMNSAILYPMTRALFASGVRFPLAVDLGMSERMVQQLAIVGQRYAASNQPETILWPTHEAVIAGCKTTEVEVGTRELPQPAQSDVNAILTQIAGSLFADIEAKAAHWQRSRPIPPPIQRATTYAVSEPVDVTPMVEQFRSAYSNLQEIWSLVLPPQSLLGLKRLSIVDAAAFRMPDSLWVRIVYDFVVAYRLRTINRGHLLGALIPLYLAWVASHINLTASGEDAETHVEAVASAFEVDKPYLVSRWRWPDRFNP